MYKKIVRTGKVLENLEQALKRCGVEDGMTLSFHHHLRNGDQVVNMVLEAAARLGLRDLRVAASALFQVHLPLADHIRKGVVSRIDAGGVSGGLGEALLDTDLEPMLFRTHGGRARAINSGELAIDVAFVAASAVDRLGTLSGLEGPSAFGSIGYAIPDSLHARHVVAVTDHLTDSPLRHASITHDYVDFIVPVDRIGDPEGIESGTTRLTRDPVALCIARRACTLIEHSGLLGDGMNLQTGAGGASLAAAHFLRDVMRRRGLTGGFLSGGTTKYLVDMLEEGLFQTMYDVQCFDRSAVRSLGRNPNHVEMSASQYADPRQKSCTVNALDIVLLGAAEIDVNFNVNVHTNSNGVIIAGSGGHSDTAQGAKLAVIVAPLVRGRLPIVVDAVTTRSTPGSTIDALVTEFGIAVNPANTELRDRLRQAGVDILDIEELRALALSLSGKPEPLEQGNRLVARVEYRDGTIIDEIRAPA